ncbi:hypothetical protein [Henriciella aquimarina]|uniref:hypothetical protein n=1 Tax=Henriciella aquimarina TaxID=545261 RepID=UPI00117B4987|nr:hypothetical protein [Henriciella aquimarina]
MRSPDPDTLSALRQQIEREQHDLPPAARRMARAIRQKHGDCVRAFLFYGSSRREGDQAGKMLDFYVLVDRYSDVHGHGLRQLASLLIPPSVHYLEIPSGTGPPLRSKYAIMSERAFHRRTRGGAFESMLWGRFAQPVLIDADTPARHNRLVDTMALACFHLADETLPLIGEETEIDDIWARGLYESYRTELRPENARQRAAELVERFSDRYRALTDAIFGDSQESRAVALGRVGWFGRQAGRTRWALRRVLGKVMASLRVVKAAFTFDAGLDYILEKIEGHSDVRIKVTESERRHPLLHSPVLAWKILRARTLR